MQIKGDSYSVFYDEDKKSIDVFGSIRLRGTDQYKEILDWHPTQSSIDNIVATAVKWYNKKNKKDIQ